MFTNNYINFRHNMFFGVTSGTSNGVTAKKLVRHTGASFSMYAHQGVLYSDIGYALGNAKFGGLADSDTSVNGSGVRFGSGSTPATREDYKLDSPFNYSDTGVTIVSKAIFFTEEDAGRYSVSGIYAIQNNLSEPLTIREIGLFCDVPYSSNASYRYSALMERTVLEEPITIEPGKAKNITYKVLFYH